jgi:hypothetical protein
MADTTRCAATTAVVELDTGYGVVTLETAHIVRDDRLAQLEADRAGTTQTHNRPPETRVNFGSSSR